MSANINPLGKKFGCLIVVPTLNYCAAGSAEKENEAPAGMRLKEALRERAIASGVSMCTGHFTYSCNQQTAGTPATMAAAAIKDHQLWAQYGVQLSSSVETVPTSNSALRPGAGEVALVEYSLDNVEDFLSVLDTLVPSLKEDVDEEGRPEPLVVMAFADDGAGYTSTADRNRNRGVVEWNAMDWIRGAYDNNVHETAQSRASSDCDEVVVSVPFAMLHSRLVRDENGIEFRHLGEKGGLGETTLEGVLREVLFKVGSHPKYGA